MNLQPGPPDIRAQSTLSTPTCECDFNQDVDKKPCIKRAWVLQKRVLSQQIIYFITAHIYYECGDRLLCEQITKLFP